MTRKFSKNEKEMIQRFFDFDLSDAEMESFKLKMETDSEFEKEVYDYQKAMLVVDALEEKEPIPKIEIKQGVNTKGSNNISKVITASLLLLLLFAIAYFYFKNGSEVISEQKIYANVEQFVSDISEDIMRGEDSSSTDPLLDIRETIIKVKGLDEEGKEDEAILEINNLILNLDNIDSKEVALWWLAKLYMEKGDVQLARNILYEISNHPRLNSAKRAGDILSQYK